MYKTGIILAVLLLVIASGCSTTSRKSNAQLSQEYLSKAQEYEEQGRLVEALEQYKLAIAVEPENQLAQEKSTSIERELNKKAEEHYQIGLRFHSRGQYNEARKEFLTALRYNPEHAGAKDKLTTRKEIDQVKRYIVHTVQPDESISTLAQKYYGDYRKFHLIAEYNELEDATKVSVGQEIKIPVVEGIPIIADRATIQTETGASPESMSGEIITVKRSVTHIIQPGESLSKLAAMYYGDYTKYNIIAEFNGLAQGTSVRVGQEIKIPEVEGVPFLAKGKMEEEKQAPIIQEPPAATEKVIEKPKEEEPPAVEDQTANYRELGIELYKNKEYADAITEFNKVLNVNPSDSSAREYIAKSHFQQGLTLFRKEQYLKARDEFKASLEYDQDCKKCNENIKKCEDKYKEIHYNKGLAYFGDQKLADAIGEWESVYALDPNYKDVSNNLTKARTLLERLESIKRSKTKE